jgi:hypothetical protein
MKARDGAKREGRGIFPQMQTFFQALGLVA